MTKKISIVEKKNSELQSERETLVNELKEANDKIDNLTKVYQNTKFWTHGN